MAPKTEELADALKFFIGRHDTYAIQKDDGSYLRVMRGLTDSVLLAHVKGKTTASAYTTGDSGGSPVAMLDIDSKEPPAREIAQFAVNFLAHWNLPAFIEPSGKKGYHVWVVFKHVLSAEKAQRLMRIVMAQWEEANGPPPFMVELNPKQTKATTKDSPGNCVKLPWGRHRVTGKRTTILNPNFEPQPDWGLQVVLEAPAVTEDDLDRVIEEYPEPPPPQRPEGEGAKPPTGYGLPCFGKMLEGVAPGFRHIACLRLAVQMRRQGWGQDRALDVLIEWNGHNDPPNDESDIRAAVRSAWMDNADGSPRYGLGCADLEAAGFCDSSCPVWKKRYEEYDDRVEKPKTKRDLVMERTRAVSIEGTNSGTEKVKVNCPLLADEIMSRNIYATYADTHEVLLYQNGVYTCGGAEWAMAEAKYCLLDYATKHRINEVVGNIQWSTFRERVTFNPNPYLIVLDNGTLDIRTGELLPHNPEHWATYRLPVRYDKEADCPRVRQFLREVLNATDEPVIQELFGYCLEPTYFIHRAFLFVGDGANGKSTLIELLRSFLGPHNCATVSLQNLDASRFSTSMLHDKMVNLYADVEATKITKTGHFKMLTGGDSIEAEKKYASGFNFKNRAKLVFSSNQPPRVYNEDSFAFWRRWILLNFPNQFDSGQADKRLLDKLTTPSELSGLLNLAIAGLHRLWDYGDFTYSPTAEEVSRQYHEASNPITAFIASCCVTGAEESVPKEVIYDGYRTYCRQRNLPIMPRESFHRALKNNPEVTLQAVRHRTDEGQVYYWQGIRLAEEDEVGGESADIEF